MTARLAGQHLSFGAQGAIDIAGAALLILCREDAAARQGVADLADVARIIVAAQAAKDAIGLTNPPLPDAVGVGGLRRPLGVEGDAEVRDGVTALVAAAVAILQALATAV
jgi:hypothetical protein